MSRHLVVYPTMQELRHELLRLDAAHHIIPDGPGQKTLDQVPEDGIASVQVKPGADAEQEVQARARIVAGLQAQHGITDLNQGRVDEDAPRRGWALCQKQKEQPPKQQKQNNKHNNQTKNTGRE